MEVMDEIGTWMGAIPIMGSFQRAKYRRGFFVCDYSSILDLPNRGMTYMVCLLALMSKSVVVPGHQFSLFGDQIKSETPVVVN